MEKEMFKPTRKQILDSLVSSGSEVIDNEEKQWEWFKICVRCVDEGSDIQKYVLKESLEFMKDLQSFEINIVTEKFLNKNYEYNIAMQILNIVFKCSDKGSKFVESVTQKDYSNNGIKSK